MQVTWKITKKRGNWRPVLTYTCTKEDWEDELRVPDGDSDITIPSVKMDWGKFQAYCLPGQAERGENYVPPEHNLQFPRIGCNSDNFTVPLPWRPGAAPEFPDVTRAMQAFMLEWERRVLQTIDSGAVNTSGEIEHSPEYKKAVAPYVAARKMLNNA